MNQRIIHLGSTLIVCVSFGLATRCSVLAARCSVLAAPSSALAAFSHKATGRVSTKVDGEITHVLMD